MRASFLDDVYRAPRNEARDAAARHTWRNHAGPNRAKTCCSRGFRRSGGNRSCESDTYGPASVTESAVMLPRSSFRVLSPTDDDELEDDDPDDEDEEVEEDEEDEGDEEVWQVRLT